MIDLEITEGVAFSTLNVPATRNALNNELAGKVRSEVFQLFSASAHPHGRPVLHSPGGLAAKAG